MAHWWRGVKILDSLKDPPRSMTWADPSTSLGLSVSCVVHDRQDRPMCKAPIGCRYSVLSFTGSVL